MQGEADRQRELLDVEALAGHLLPAGSVFAFLAAHRLELFPSDMFTDLFPSGRGRPSIPPEVIASVLVLQSLYGYSDREAAEALEPAIPLFRSPIDSTARWSNAPSPGSPEEHAACPTAAWPRTTPGCTTAPQPSTCVVF